MNYFSILLAAARGVRIGSLGGGQDVKLVESLGGERPRSKTVQRLVYTNFSIKQTRRALAQVVYREACRNTCRGAAMYLKVVRFSGEESKTKACTSSFSRSEKKQLGVWGVLQAPPTGFGAEPRKILSFMP